MATRPDRRAGTLLRTAETSDPQGEPLGGIPLASIEALSMTVVRLAYRVADTQARRGARLAERLREVGRDAVGEDPGLKGLDATEQLVFRYMMTALGWLEAAAAPGAGSPIKRLLGAEYSLFGSLFGLSPSTASGGSRQDAAGDEASPRHSSKVRQSEAAAAATTPRSLGVRIRHGGTRRAVRVETFEYEPPIDTSAVVLDPLEFYADGGVGTQLSVQAHLGFDPDGRGVLSLKLEPDAQPGRWRAALCDSTGLQLGMLEISI